MEQFEETELLQRYKQVIQKPLNIVFSGLSILTAATWVFTMYLTVHLKWTLSLYRLQINLSVWESLVFCQTFKVYLLIWYFYIVMMVMSPCFALTLQMNKLIYVLFKIDTPSLSWFYKFHLCFYLNDIKCI